MKKLDRQKECLCFDYFGTMSDKCEGYFTPYKSAAKQRYCTPCKPIVLREHNRRLRARRKSQLDFPEGYTGLFTNGKRCSNCGDKCVPEEHRYFCLYCWRLLGWLVPHELSPVAESPVYFVNAYDKMERNGPVIIYSSDSYSQDELQDMVPSIQGPFHKSKDPIRDNVYYVYHGQGKHHSTAWKDESGKWHFVQAERWRLV